MEKLLNEGIIRKELDGLKVLSNGDLTKNLQLLQTNFQKKLKQK